jgi:hypothetical protein
MQTALAERPLTLLDIVAVVSGFTDNEEETAAVINHLLSSEQISFRKGPQEIETLLS